MSTVDAFSGSVSSGNLILGTDGALYGVNYTVSASVTGGVIYRAAVDGSAIITLHQLDPTEGVSPRGGLLQASDGYLYGTTQYGGHTTLYTTGTIYRIAPDGANFSIIFRFDDYTSLNANSGPINVDGAYPQCELIEGSDGALYGVTTAGGPNGTGVVFRVSKDGTGYQVLHTFGAITSPAGVTPITNDDGATPTGALVDGKDGNLYGTASAGGENGRGVIFRLAYDGSNFAVIYEFSAANSSTNTGLLTNSDGVIPLAGLLDADDGFLYGVASQGGSIGYGTVFAVSRDGQVFNVLHSFGGADGSEPKAALLLGADGKLYGTTASGGTDSKGGSTLYGTIFSIGRDGAGFSSLWSMDGKNGITPLTKLVQISNTVFEGTNSTGGNCSAGTIYRLSLSGDTITGSTGCGYKRSTGAVDPGLVLLLGGLGLARRRRT
ncbi:MAG TPA: choice-of-anchor tandem repeat GloVer-containing protein [Steroidobacteraceae bacterium]|nr:choice-of-anchor tandem repeat GloVer-containing protein [Steroidobacteraceae bacterium]